MSGRRLRTRKQLTPPISPAPAVSTRPRRGTVGKPAPPTTIERSSPDESRTSSIRLTVKADPKKLKEATSGTIAKGRGRDSFEPGEIVRGARSTRKKAIIESEPEDDEEDEAEEEEEVEEDEEVDEDEEDAEGSDEEEEDEDEEEEEEEDEDADGSADEEMADEDEDAEGSAEDEEMEDAPPIVPKGKLSITKPQVTITPAKPLLSVEEKEMTMDEDDEELSSLDEDEELEGGEDELGTGVGEDEEMSDEDISRSATPDLSKLTRRQRAEAAGLMALSNEAQKKKHLTADEISLRRAEMARRRKALSEKRNDEEKQDTINRLLKRQASKRQRKADVEADRIAEEGEDFDGVRPSKVYARYVQNTKGAMLGVPREWVDAGYVGGVFGKEGVKGGRGWSGRMVEVVE